ncbi:hypothetical protein D3H64_04310 [Atopobacter sp. AH10]|uniref:hypothetical protein n=1 Tax=Atopobacter sp. AH10 TaxID=2315861 RepID=UPI000EF22A59|nr:hypothetical protein [Atopobacter sp. AH10]RLK63463.1 hypothetical protein D3H64_04310 [Atopobacter sp. AH10]
MKSKVLNSIDVTQLKIPEELLTLSRKDYSALLEEDLQKLSRQYSKDKERENGEALVLGDVVSISASCDQEGAPAKFNREKATIKLGKGFYDKAIENELIGKLVGESYSLTTGDFTVEVKILAAKFMDIQPVNDEMIQKEEINGVDTLEEYKRVMLNSFKENDDWNHIYDHILPKISDQIFDQVKFDVDEEEMDQFVTEWVEADKEACTYEEEELSFEEYAAKETGLSEDDPGLEDALKEKYKADFYLELIYIDLGKKLYQASEEDFKAELDQAREYGVDEEYIASMTYEKFLEGHWIELGRNELFQHIIKQFKN